MTKPLTIALLALTALVLYFPAGAAAQAPGIGDAGIYQTRLANGLQVIAVEDHAAPVIHTSVFYRFGSLDETPGKTGLAHGLEHMMFRGTPSLSAGGLDDVIARVGGQMNGNTDYDYTTFLLDMPAAKLDVALQIESDRMQHAALSAGSWRIEQRAVLNEIQGDYSSPFYNLLSRVRAAAYPGLPAGRTPAGVVSDVAGASAADLRKYYQQWYAPNNATLVIAGNVQHDAAFALAQRYFGRIPRRATPAHANMHPAAATGKTVEAEFPFPFEVLDLAYAVPGDTEPGEPAISTLAALIPNQRGPFYQALVQSNIALELNANADTQLRGGLMHVFIILNSGHTAAQAQQVFQDVMDAQLRSGFSASLVEAAKNSTLADRTFSADSVASLADLAGYTYGLVGEHVGDEDRRLASLTPADILRTAKTYLATPNVVGHLTPNERPPSGSEKSNAAVSDNFSGRAPNGPIVVPPTIDRELRRPPTTRSKLAPTAFTLSNGIHVLLQPKTDRQTVYIAGEIESSPAFVPAGKEGIDRLASQLANFGSEHYSFEQLRKTADDLGAGIDLGAHFDAHGMASDLDTLLAALADGEAHPTFPDPWFDQVRSQLASTVTSEQHLSGVLVTRVYLSHLLHPTDPALRVPTGSTVQSITRADLLAYAHRYWRPDLTTIAIVGNVTPATARAALERTFGTWSAAGPAPSLAERSIPPAHGGHAYISTAADQVFVELGQPAIGRTNKDFDAFNVLTELLGGNGYFQSRLWQELRQNRGLVYSIGTDLKANRWRGDLEVSFNAAPANVRTAISLVRDQMRRLRDSRVSQTELEQAKLRLVSESLLSEASASGQLAQVLDIGRSSLPTSYYATLTQHYSGITAADVQRVAREYLRPESLIQIYAGPQGPWAEDAL